MDIDVAIAPMGKEELEKLISLLREEGFIAALNEAEFALKEKSHFTAMDSHLPYRLDFKGIYTPLDAATFKRRTQVTVLGEKVWIETAEDLTLAKLFYGSEQDVEDVTSIILKQGEKLNIQYIAECSKNMNTYKLLKKILEYVNYPSLSEGASCFNDGACCYSYQ